MHRHDLSKLPDGHGYLVIEVGGDTKAEADEKGRAIIATLEKAGGGLMGTKLYDDPEGEAHIWKVREAGLGATAFIPGKPDTHEGWEDSAVPPERLGEYLRGLKELADRYGYESALYGHYGQGCVHARWNFDLATVDGIATWRRFLDDAAELVLSLGGSLSGEHGDGQSRAELLPKMFGDELVEAFREFKAIWDPDGRMNPGKVVDPYPIASNLRISPDYKPPAAEDTFRLPARRRQLCARDHPLRRDRQLPPNERRSHVPELHGDARGEALDPRPRPPALGDAERRGARAVALRGGARRARPVPLMQGLHQRLPRSRRHADPQGRVPLPPLRAAGAATARLRVRADRPLGAGSPRAHPGSRTSSHRRPG